MSEGSDAGPSLADYLTQLQAQLGRVLAPPADAAARFRVDGVTLEVEVAYTAAAQGDGDFRVIDVAGRDAGHAAHASVQRLTVHLGRAPALVVPKPMPLPDATAGTPPAVPATTRLDSRPTEMPPCKP